MTFVTFLKNRIVEIKSIFLNYCSEFIHGRHGNLQGCLIVEVAKRTLRECFYD